MSHPSDIEPPTPRQFRLTVLVTALVAMGTWWGLGLPYSLFAWLLDPQQLRWVLICYAWEVPVAGCVGPVLFSLVWFHDIQRRWERVFRAGDDVDPAEAAALEATVLDYPMRIAWVLLITSLVGYGAGALQLRLFAQVPVTEFVKVGLLGLATGLISALFAFLYLEWLLAPLLQRFGTLRALVPPAGRRVPLQVKVFACSLVLTLTAPLLLGPILYSRGERILEEEIGRRVLTEAHHLAAKLDEQGQARAADPDWWRQHEQNMALGPSGWASLLDGDGSSIAGSAQVRRLADEGLRPEVVRSVLSGRDGYRVDRVYVPRVIGFAALADPHQRVVAVVHRNDFGGELDRMLQRGVAVFGATLVLALLQTFLFSRRLTGPIAIATRMATDMAHTPDRPLPTVPVRTNDEVGELATALNQMMRRLEEARAELERRSAQAEAANRAKDEFLSILSHELRTPLTPILTWARMLRRGGLAPAAAARGLESIERNATAQARLVEDLLDVSRIISGKLRLEIHPVELRGVIEAATESVRPAAAAKGIRLESAYDPRVGRLAVDPDRMQQVVWNLLSNAVKFTPGGGRVQVGLARRNAHVELTVRDTGQGIGSTFLPHLFERFRQGDGSTTRTHGGLGLGLAIVRHLVELHGGTVDAASEGEGRGATFTVKLPAAMATDDLPDVRRGRGAPGEQGERSTYAALDGLHILVVDDEPDTCEVLGSLFSECGAETRTATSASQALQVLDRWKVDVLVSDIGMPGEDGYALIRKFREREDGESIPAVALTAYARPEDREEALSAGFQIHLPKPVDPVEAVSAVANVARRA